MKSNVLILLGLSVLTVISFAETNTNSNANTNNQWLLLFDGKSVDQWRSFKTDSFPTKGWEIKDGFLHLKPGGRGGDIITKKTFSDFILEWQWIASTGCNSGVKYFIRQENGPIGPEYQMLDDLNNPEGKPGKHCTASLYDVLAPVELLSKPAGQTNVSRIVVHNNSVEHWLNGKMVLKYDLTSQELLDAVQKSKFKNLSFYGKKCQGHILIQDHSHEIWIKEIKILELH